MNNADVLRALMRDHGLTRARAAELMMVAQKTVDGWLAPPGATCHRGMADRHIAMLMLQLEGARVS